MRSLLFTFLLFFSAVTWAQEVMDLNLHETMPVGEATDPKNQLTKQAVEKVSLESIESFIGKERLAANRKKIEEKIIANSSKYLLSMRTGQVQKEKGNFALDVQLKISLKNLRSLLLAEGLLYQMDGTPTLLPAVRISDQVALQTYAWWDAKNSSSSFAKGAFDIFIADLAGKIKSTNFQLRTPWKDKKALNAKVSDKLTSIEALQLAEASKSAILMRGEITFTPKEVTGSYVITVNLTATQTSNGRVMADVQRKYETQPGSYRNVIVPKFKEVSPKIAADLVVQLDDAWKKGQFGTQLVKLAVRSDLTPKQLEAFKKTLLLQVRDIKGIRERLLSAGRTVYDIDSSTPAQQLALTLKGQNLTQFKVQVADVENEEIEIRVSPL